MASDQSLFDSICAGDRNSVQDLVQKALNAGADPESLLSESMIPAMRDVGERFERGEIFIPEMMVAGRAVQVVLDILEPLLAEGEHEPVAKICIGTVKGDMHDIGKNLVTIMLKAADFEVEDLGVDCSVEKYEDAVARGARAVLCSALLTTTMPYMKTVADHFKEDPNVKVVIGGAPVTQAYADEIGAAGYGANASDAVRVVAKCLEIQ